MKYVCLLLLWVPLFAVGQGKGKGSSKSKLPAISQANLEKLVKAEEELNPLAFTMFTDTSNLERMRACYTFIPKFVEALKVPGSFAYPFDSVPILSLLYPTDSSFRVITWQVTLEGGSYRYFGTIQMNDGKDLKLYPLIDRTDSIASPHDTLLSPSYWYGAFYYNLIETKAKGKTYYTLFGFDGNDLFSRIKVMDVLHFEEGKPVFGAPIFEIPDSISQEFPYVVKKPLTRFMVYYKFDAKLTLNYNPDDDIVVFDHIKSTHDFGKDIPMSLVPDGSYDAFEWKNGKWVYISNVYELTIDRGNPPLPNPSPTIKGDIKQPVQED